MIRAYAVVLLLSGILRSWTGSIDRCARDAILIPSRTHTSYKKSAIENDALVLLPSSFRLERVTITLDIKMPEILELFSVNLLE